jgi:hypothetical protein
VKTFSYLLKRTNGKIQVVTWFYEGCQFITMDSDDGIHCSENGNWDIMACKDCGGDYEVIGNIFENKELLKT